MIDLTKLQQSADAIETQYRLARIVLFQPLDHLERFHGVTISAAHGVHSSSSVKLAEIIGHWPVPKYSTLDIDGESDDDSIEKRIAGVREIVWLIGSTAAVGSSFNLYRNRATCERCGATLERVSIRVSIAWNGKTLMREYLLPDG